MSKARMYEEKTEELLNPIVEQHNFELVDVEYVKEAGNWYLRAYIDKEGGITLDDCELISRTFSDILDKEDYIDDSYIFEVSSPGLGRQLKKDKHFERNLGEEVEVKLFKPLQWTENGKEVKAKELVGILDGFDETNLKIYLDDDTTLTIPRKDIAIVRLTFDF